MAYQFISLADAKTFTNPAWSLIPIREQGVTTGYHAVRSIIHGHTGN